VVAAAALSFLPLHEWAESLAAWLDELGWAGVLLFAGLYVLATILLVPMWTFTVAAGALFGVAWGFVLVAISATAGATVAFLLSRYALRERVKKYFARNALLRTVNRALRGASWKVVLLLRVSPLVPFGIQNYFFGVSRVTLPQYVVGTALGEIPGIVVYLWLGATGRAVLGGGSPAEWGLLGAGIVATIAAAWLIGRTAKKQLGIRA
jgi:uncharacterized membrane protein YdjX (TVP38/TMEM64 family)